MFLVQASNGLVKQGWELTYYSHGEMEKAMSSSQGEVALVTEFNGEKCLLKVSYWCQSKHWIPSPLSNGAKNECD